VPTASLSLRQSVAVCRSVLFPPTSVLSGRRVGRDSLESPWSEAAGWGGLQQAEQRSRTWPRPGVPQPLRSGSVSLPQLPTKQSRRSIKRLGLLSGARPCAEIDGVSVAVCRLHGDTGPATCTVTYVSDGV